MVHLEVIRYTDEEVVIKLVVKVAVESPVYVAGLERGDVIVEINEEIISDRQKATAVFQRFRVDDRCSLKIIRAGKTQLLQMHFIERHPAKQGRF